MPRIKGENWNSVRPDISDHRPPEWARLPVGKNPNQQIDESLEEFRWNHGCFVSLLVGGGIATAAVWVANNPELFQRAVNSLLSR